MIRVEGKGGIYAQILADSISPAGIRLTSFEISYPRIILAEYNTHAMISKASASSRAIPFPKMVESLTGMPVRFGQANPGMQDKGEDFEELFFVPDYLSPGVTSEHWEELFEGSQYGASKDIRGCDGMTAEQAWEEAKHRAVQMSETFYKAGFHKQVYNRLTEPFQMMKTVTTATEWNNFFWLRNDDAADPTLHELARCMQEARDKSTPFELQPGQWHTPYVSWGVAEDGTVWWRDEHGSHVRTTWEQILKVSAARCAAVSFRNVDYSMAKSEEVFARLVGEDRKHASAFEHQATPMRPFTEVFYRPEDDVGEYINLPTVSETWETGISHMDRSGQLWSGKLRGFICHRKLIAGENVEG